MYSGAGRIVSARMRPFSLAGRLRGATVSLGAPLSGAAGAVEGTTGLTVADYAEEVLAVDPIVDARDGGVAAIEVKLARGDGHTRSAAPPAPRPAGRPAPKRGHRHHRTGGPPARRWHRHRSRSPARPVIAEAKLSGMGR
jgi:hypothetical protein